MPDIFLSYNREDQAAARRFAEAFQAEGFEVWWDTTLRAGEAYDEVTEAALNQARAVVVLWSPRSVVSRWVRAEATQADRNKTLVPVTIEACRRPIMFELTQTADLSNWDGQASDGAWQAFLADVKRFVERAPGAASPGSPIVAPRQSTAPSPQRISICVLPFANMSRDDDQEYFADGISEDIITDLSKVSALGVIARNSAFAFKGKSVDIIQVARQLGVTHVLEGSVRKAGNRVRITAQLIGGSTNEHVWAERWDRDLDDIFALQDEISQAIVGALKLKLLPEEKKAIEHRGTTNLEAYDKYLRARSLANSAATVPDFYRALELCRHALEIDPDFTPAYSALVSLYAYVETWAPTNLAQLRKDRYALADQAVARAPDYWGTYLLDGLRLAEGKDWLAAVTAFEAASRLAPESEADVPLQLASSLAVVGRMNDAVRVLEKARAADPLSALISQRLQMAYFMDRRDDDSRAEYLRSLDRPGLREAMEHTALFREWNLGDGGATAAQFRRYLDSQTIGMPFLVDCLKSLDHPEAAHAMLRRAFEDPANQDATRMMIIGLHAGFYGDAELTVSALRRGLLDFDYAAKYMLWWPFRNDARRTAAFKELVRNLGLYDYWRASGNWGDFARPVGDDDFEIIQ